MNRLGICICLPSDTIEHLLLNSIVHFVPVHKVIVDERQQQFVIIREVVSTGSSFKIRYIGDNSFLEKPHFKVYTCFHRCEFAIPLAILLCQHCFIRFE
jgi:hypothetical protein